MATITGTRSPLFWRNIPGGLPAILDASKFSGNTFFVDSNATNAADTAGKGYHPDYPFATLDYAVGQCTANQGDVIFVLPGHAETINAAAAIDLDVAGITVIGLGNGEDRPTITIGSSEDASTVEIGAEDVKISNMVFQPGNDGVDILLDINADGAIIEDCELRSDETNAYQADTYIDINGGGANAADRCTIRRCKISSITAGATQAINIGAVEDALVIEDCWIDGDFTAAAVLSGSAFTNALIRRNVISNRAAGVHAVEFTAACTGLFVDNRMYSSTLGTILDPGSLMCLGNLETDAIDQAGVDSPRTSAGGFPNDSITADAIAAAAIDAATFAADALQAMQDEAEDALEGENLDHLAATAVANNADMTTEVIDGSVLSNIMTKGADTSDFDPATDSLEGIADRIGAPVGADISADIAAIKLQTDEIGSAAGASIAADIAAIQAEVDKVDSVTMVAAPVAGSLARYVASGGTALGTELPDSVSLYDVTGGFSGDGGANQDDSIKASLDLAHTEIGANADSATTDNLHGKIGTDTEMADRSVYDLVNGGGPTSAAAAAVPGNDVSLMGALRAVYNLSVPATATGETVIDEGDYDWTADYPSLLTIVPAAGAPLADVVVHLDMDKAATGFATTYAAQTLSLYVERRIDGTNWRRELIAEAALAGDSADARNIKVDIGDVGVNERVRIVGDLSAENGGATETTIPYAVTYKALAAPTITPLTATA